MLPFRTQGPPVVLQSGSVCRRAAQTVAFHCPRQARPHLRTPALQVAHLSYHTSFPHAAFNPFHFLAPLDGSPSTLTSCGRDSCRGQGSAMAVAIYTGAAVRYVHVAAGRREAQPLPASPLARQHSSGDDEASSSASRFPSPESAAAAPRASLYAASPAGQRTPVQPQALSQGSPQQQQPRMSSPQQQRAGSVSPAPPALRGFPPHRHSWPHPQRAPQERSPALPCGAPGGDELQVQTALVPCAHACGGSRGSCALFWQQHRRLFAKTSSGSGAMAAVSLTVAPLQLDLEACIFQALQQEGLPPAALADYAAAPVQAGTWQGQDGLLLLAVLRLVREDPPSGDQGSRQQGWAACLPAQQLGQQPVHRSACALLHAAAADGAATLVEWLEPPYPWHDDLSAFMVQQTAFAGRQCWCNRHPVMLLAA